MAFINAFFFAVVDVRRFRAGAKNSKRAPTQPAFFLDPAGFGQLVSQFSKAMLEFAHLGYNFTYFFFIFVPRPFGA